MASAIRNNIDEASAISVYVAPARILASVPPKVSSTYEPLSSSSNATNRLNRSPDRNASATPATITRNAGWKIAIGASCSCSS